jgi:Sad1 / UNC-like C-terminal
MFEQPNCPAPSPDDGAASELEPSIEISAEVDVLLPPTVAPDAPDAPAAPPVSSDALPVCQTPPLASIAPPPEHSLFTIHLGNTVTDPSWTLPDVSARATGVPLTPKASPSEEVQAHARNVNERCENIDELASPRRLQHPNSSIPENALALARLRSGKLARSIGNRLYRPANDVARCVGDAFRSLSALVDTMSSAFGSESINDRSQPLSQSAGTTSDMNDKVVETSGHIDQAKKWHALTARDRPFNFASVDAGARVLAASSNAAGAKNTLSNNPDTYMLVACAGDGVGGSRWIDIELSEEVVLTSLEIGNFEFYSSFPRRIALLGSTSYPPKKWSTLALFDAASVRTVQRFDLVDRAVARYIRVIFAGKQGGEHYCPISVIRAFGKTLIADWKEELEPEGLDSRETPHAGSGVIGAAPSQILTGKVSDNNNPAKSQSLDSASTSANLRAYSSDFSSSPYVDLNSGDSERAASPLDHGQSTLASRSKSDTVNYEADSASRQANDMNLDANTGRTPDLASTPAASSLEAQQESQTSETKSVEGQLRRDANASATVSRPTPGGAQAAASGAASVVEDDLSEDDMNLLSAVQEQLTSSSSQEVNVFRKVTRMIRVLELNQSLTNQYIDTHLAKYAAALATVRTEAHYAHEEAAVARSLLASLASSTQSSMDDMASASRRRDVLICILLVMVAILVGAQWVLWSALTGVQVHAAAHGQELLAMSLVDSGMTSRARSHSSHEDDIEVSMMTKPEPDVASADSKRRRRKARRNSGVPLFPSTNHLEESSSPNRAHPRSRRSLDGVPYQSISSVLDLPTSPTDGNSNRLSLRHARSARPTASTLPRSGLLPQSRANFFASINPFGVLGIAAMNMSEEGAGRAAAGERMLRSKSVGTVASIAGKQK